MNSQPAHNNDLIIVCHSLHTLQIYHSGNSLLHQELNTPEDGNIHTGALLSYPLARLIPRFIVDCRVVPALYYNAQPLYLHGYSSTRKNFTNSGALCNTHPNILYVLDNAWSRTMQIAETRFWDAFISKELVTYHLTKNLAFTRFHLIGYSIKTFFPQKKKIVVTAPQKGNLLLILMFDFRPDDVQ